MKTNLAEIYNSLPESDAPEIVAKFEENNKRFKYYVSNDGAQKLYVACYNSMKQLFVDNGDIKQPDDSYVYKMMFLFQSHDLAPSTTLAAFDKFVQKYINGFASLKAFLEGRHIASFKFADNAEYGIFDYDVVAMRKALPTLGYTLLKNLRDIGKIQASNDGLFPQDLRTFKHSALKVKFPNAEKNMKLAELCNLYDGNVAQFDDMIALMEKGVLLSEGGRLLPKAVDNLPDVIVHYLNPETGSNYYVVKLPSHDLRAMMLGNITGNCQTLSNGDADPFIIDGITRPNNGFYVIIKEGRKSFDPANIDWENLEKNGHEIVGQSYAWIGRDGKSITWEAPQIIKDRAPNIDIKEVLTGFGKAIESQGFDRVTIGNHRSGLEGARNYNFDDSRTIYQNTDSHNIFTEGFRYHWSVDGHYETYVSSRLQEIRKEITRVAGEAYASSVISVQQGEALLQFLPGKSFNPTVQRVLMSCYLTKEWSLEKLESLLSILGEKSEAELESILQHKALYHYGLTIEYASKIPAEVMTLVDAIVKPHHGKRSKLASLVTSLDELAENILSATSILDIQRAAVKLIAKNLCDNAGDLAYVDTMSESKIDFIVNNYNAINLLYKKAYTVATIAELEDTKFATLAEHYRFIEVIVNYTGQTMQEYVGKFESSLMMKRDILNNLLTHPLMPRITCDPSVIDSLSEEKLDLLLKHEILGIPAYRDILNTAPDSDIPALKKQLLVSWAEKHSLFENVAAIYIPEAILDILLSSEVMSFYEHDVKSLDPAITGYFMQLETLIQLPEAKLRLLFSYEAQRQYRNKVSPESWMDMDVDAIIKSFEKVVHMTGPHYATYSFKDALQRVLPEEVLKHFGIDALYKCFSDASYTYVPCLITTDRFTVAQKIKILQQVLDGSLGDKLSEIVGSVGCIASISNISPEQQEQITQYILDHKPLAEAALILSELNYGVSVNVLNHIDMESILVSWDGSRFNYPYWVNDAAVELDWDIIKYFGLYRMGRLSDQSYSHAQKYCMFTSSIPLQDRIKILEFAENMADASAIFSLLDNILNLEMCIISHMGIDQVLPLCGNGESVVFGNPSWLVQCKAEMGAVGVGVDSGAWGYD